MDQDALRKLEESEKKSNRSFTYQVATEKRIQSGVVNFVNYKKLNNFPVENALINTSLPIIESHFYVVSEVPEDSNVYGIPSGSAEGHRENVSSLKQADVFMAEVSSSWNQNHLSSGSAEGHRENVSSLKQADVFMAEVSSSWSQDHLSNTLKSVTLKFTSGDILTTTGEVGGGKSTLLFAILGELPLSEGEISCYNKVAYAPQIPWVFSGTMRENILFGLPFDEQSFKRL